METQNVTIRVPKPLLRAAKHVALERGVTVTNLILEGLQRVTNKQSDYQNAQTDFLGHLERLGAVSRRKKGQAMPSREETHERAS